MLAKALRDGNRLGKEHLLVFAEELIGGGQQFGSARSNQPRRQHHHVLVAGVGAGQRPLEGEGVLGVTHRHHHASGFDLEHIAAHRVLVFQLEVLLHLHFGSGSPAPVVVLRNSEDDEEGGCEENAADGGHRFSEQVHDRRGQQHHED